MILGKKKQERKPKIKKAIATVAKKQINAIKRLGIKTPGMAK